MISSVTFSQQFSQAIESHKNAHSKEPILLLFHLVPVSVSLSIFLFFITWYIVYYIIYTLHTLFLLQLNTSAIIMKEEKKIGSKYLEMMENNILSFLHLKMSHTCMVRSYTFTIIKMVINIEYYFAFVWIDQVFCFPSTNTVNMYEYEQPEVGNYFDTTDYAMSHIHMCVPGYYYLLRPQTPSKQTSLIPII